ncbi:MAG: Fe-S cluster assembly protein SufD [Chlamydiales bacterium]|nr:Fe-S cluster assembly protein SufD [Chlamydiales bacterium]
MLAALLQEQYIRREKDKSNYSFAHKKTAWERFCNELSLPTKKTDGFEYLPLEQLFQSTFLHHTSVGCIDEEMLDQVIYPECANSYIVVFNGKLCLELSSIPSDMPITISPLSEAGQLYSNYLKGRWLQQSLEKENVFALLNLALFEDGMFLHIPKNLSLKTPLQMINIVSGGCVIHPKLHVYVGKDASCSLATTTLFLSDKPALVNEDIDIVMEEGSSLSLIDGLWEAKQHFYFSSVHATLKQDANLQQVLLTSGSYIHRKAYDIALKGEGANCSLKGLSCLHRGQAHVHTVMKHQAPRTISNQHFKSMIYDKSRSSFDGKIYVEKSALWTEAYQLNNNLLLSDHAVAFSKPNLEIFADDVKASHGCTTSQLNEEEMFYLLSRGLEKDEAMALLTEAFAKEIIEEIPFIGIQDAAKDAFSI